MTGFAFLAFTFLLYWRSLRGEFLFDDVISILGNGHVLTGNWKNALRQLWRQGLFLTFALETSIFSRDEEIKGAKGLNAPIYRALNILIHAFNGCLVMWIAENLGLDRYGATLAGLFWISHPLAVNAVANVSGRGASLSASFAFWAIGGVISQQYWMILPALLCGIFVKEDIAVLFFTISALHYVLGGAWWWIWLVFPFIGLAYRFTAIRHVMENNGNRDMISCGFDPQLKTPVYQITAFTENVLRFPLWCLGLGLSPDHDTDPHSWTSLRFWLALLVTGGAVYFIWTGTPLVQVAGIIVLVSPLAAYVFIPLPDPIVEHRAYISLLGVVLLFAYLGTLVPWWVTVLGLWYLAVVTASRAGIWLNAVTLWTAALVGKGKHLRALNNLAAAHILKSEYFLGEMCLLQALKEKPTFGSAYGNLGHIAKNQGIQLAATEPVKSRQKWEQARDQFAKACEVTPNFLLCWVELGNAHEVLGEPQKAEACYLEAVKRNSDFDPAWNRLGMIRAATQRPGEALEPLRIAIARRPDLPAYRYNLGIVHWMLKQYADAKQLFTDLPVGAFQIPPFPPEAA